MLKSDADKSTYRACQLSRPSNPKTGMQRVYRWNFGPFFSHRFRQPIGSGSWCAPCRNRTYNPV